jgi:transcription antitermination protein NusB
MQSKSRRQAREAALRALYELEIGKGNAQQAIRDTIENTDLSPDLQEFMQKLVLGIREFQATIDDQLAAIIDEWDFDRVAPIDRNILRIAAFELYHLPAVPPAVSINEAIEMAKKYSTAESGRFVNGVLGRLLGISPKANWDPAMAPAEEEVLEPAIVEDIPVETVEEGSPEAAELAKVGLWRVRSEDRKD